MLKNKKTVYVLGAGFSYPHTPCQEKILKEIFEYDGREDKFLQSRYRIKKFLKDLFQLGDERLKKIYLENILTILDKAILSNENIRNRDNVKLKKLKDDLIFCIAYVFDEKLEDTPDFYKDLSRRIVEERRKAKINEDKFAFICLNWDLLLDNQINKEAKEHNSKINNGIIKGEEHISLDYCTYTNHYEKSIKAISDSNKKTAGIKNIKLLKLHGSFNWLICKNCNRLLKKFNEKIILKASEFVAKTNCCYCNQKSLNPIIITPTLLKDLNNVHLKTIWHNAEIELMEANRVVFVGYSFPLADFEFRYLLKRCIDKDAEIEIIIDKDDEAKDRYINFFGNQIKEVDKYRKTSEEFFKKEFAFS